MKLMTENNKILNIVNDNYIAGNPIYDNSFIQIKSYAKDIDMKDVEQNQAWKFKIVDGELQYDQEKIAAKLALDIDRKREQEYSNKVDKLVIEKIRKQLKDAEIDALVAEIQARYPK
jgi:hypothetical protein